ncbi:MAG TPA: helix-turn-helix domain-containing protein [Ktedonobacterales bacterium]
MSEQSSRQYHSPRRAQQAEATRDAIVRGARRLFAQYGYQATTLQAIAQEAGVAVPTIYATFGSKAAILSTLVKSAGADEDIRALAEAAFSEPDPRRQVRLAATVMRAIMERDDDLMELLRQAGGGDPDLDAAWRQSHSQRLNRLGALAAQYAEKGALKSGLSVEEATDIQFALSSPEIYRLLTRERGWTPERFEAWLAETLTALLLREA